LSHSRPTLLGLQSPLLQYLLMTMNQSPAHVLLLELPLVL
jgi:hypothetical protein